MIQLKDDDIIIVIVCVSMGILLYNVQIFILKNNIKKSLPMLLKINKNSTKSKAVSSYMLSGINIKRMIQDQMTENNVSDVSIIRVSKRPIFKVKQREREKEREKEREVIAALPNKSFKIRSYTRKMKDGKEEESCEMFQKVEKVRNGRSNSNRIEIFNMSKEYREKDDNQQHIQNKIREILQREATIKCKPITQIFVKQPSLKMNNGPLMQFQQFQTEKYRQVAQKVNVYFNPQYSQSAEKNIVLLVSMQALYVHSKKIIKNIHGFDQGISKNIQKQASISQQQIQLLKMLSSKHYPQRIWSNTKVAFKVNNAQQLNQLKYTLQTNQINDYFCIFYPIRKYVQCWNLYQIDGLLQNTRSIVLLQAKYKLKQEFPILNGSIKTLFVATNNDNLVMLSRTISAIKSFIIDATRQQISVAEVDGEQGTIDLIKQSNLETQTYINHISQYGIREERIEVNWRELDARLDFIINSRQMKNHQNRHHNKSVFTSKDTRSKRRVLCERDNNISQTYSKNRNLSMNYVSLAEDKWEFESQKQENIDAMRQNLLFCVRTERLKQMLGQNQVVKKVETVQKGQKCDELQQITSYLRGSCKSKTNHQLVSQLLKKNTAIHRQIQQYVASIAHLTRPSTNSNNISVSNFNDKTESEQVLQTVQFITAYKIL